MLQELDDAIVRAARLREEVRGVTQEARLLGARPLLGRRGIEVGELFCLPHLGQEQLDLRERRRVRRRGRERALEQGQRGDLVAEDIAEEAPRLKEEVGRDRRRHGPEPLAVRCPLERKRELTRPLVPLRRRVQPLPCPVGQSAARHRSEDRIQHRFFVFESGLEREGLGAVCRTSATKRLRLHLVASGRQTPLFSAI